MRVDMDVNNSRTQKSKHRFINPQSEHSTLNNAAFWGYVYLYIVVVVFLFPNALNTWWVARKKTLNVNDSL